MLQRHIHERPLGKYARDLASEAGIEPVVVADVKESAAHEILTQPLHLASAPFDVAMSGDMQEWIVPQSLVQKRHASLAAFHGERRSLRDCLEQIGDTRWVRVPVPPAVVLQPRDREPS